MKWKEYADCEKCKLNGRPYVPPMLPKIRQYPCLFIGQEPGDVEQYTGVPFTGEVGKQHYSMLKAAGLSKSMLPHDNVCSCFPGKKGETEWTPNSEDAGCCLNRLREVIHEVKPKLIVALGDVAMQALTGFKGIMSNRGQYHPLLGKYGYECTVFCTLHPSFCQRARQWIPVQIQTYKEIHKFFQKGGIPDQRPDPEFYFDPTAEELRHLLYEYDDIVDCDTETTGLNPRQDTLLGWSFSTRENRAIAIYLQQPPETDPRFQVVKEFFEDETRKKSWQNGSFDTAFCRENGIHDRGFVYDTRLAQQLLNSDLPTDLDFLRAEHTTIQPYKPPKREISKMKHWSKEKMLNYACWDALTLREVRQVQQPLLSEGQLKVQEELLIPLVRAIYRMEHRGCLIDIESLAGMYAQIAPTLEELAEPFYQIGLNPRSPKQLCKYFDLKTTNIDTIQAQVKRGHPKSEMMERLLEFRKLDKQASTYLKGVYKRLEAGRIHTHFKIDGTGTGRLSSEDPNLQNVPDEMKVIYVADPGFKLVQGDYSQIELWAGAIIIYLWTGCEAMLRDLKDGRDIHYEAAKQCFPYVKTLTGDRKKDFTNREQFIAKSVVFGTFYGRSPWSIATEFGTSVADAEMWQLKLVNRYPGAAKYKAFCEDAFRRHGYLETPFGRRRYLTTITQGYNFPVQSTASDITLKSIVLNDRAKLWNWVTVHDDIVIQVKEDDTVETEVFKGIMQRSIPELLNINFKVGFKQGTDWYNLKRMEV